MADRLEHSILHRRGFSDGAITVTARESVDFVINGQSVIEMLDRARNLSSDCMGCFVRGFDDANRLAAARLFMQEAPDSPAGRVLLYTCAECGDIGCGAYTVRLSRHDDLWSWSDFAWENGYEDPQSLLLPRFEFADETYRAAILAGSSIG
ncbi:MAG TPA: hypothetical protein VGQ37_19960 [Vicinamibacterales bacterium]|jgi:hypothetical protein|nr:hypothetical protein [Vicinamibacterales bacterium]